MAEKLCEVRHWDGFNRKFTHPVPASQAEAKARERIKAGAVAAEVRDLDDTLILRLERGGSGAAVQTFPTRSSSSSPGDPAHGSKVHRKPRRT